MPLTERMTYNADTGTLTIWELTKSDAGEYKCVATNAIGTGQQIATLEYIGELV